MRDTHVLVDYKKNALLKHCKYQRYIKKIDDQNRDHDPITLNFKLHLNNLI